MGHKLAASTVKLMLYGHWMTVSAFQQANFGKQAGKLQRYQCALQPGVLYLLPFACAIVLPCVVATGKRFKSHAFTDFRVLLASTKRAAEVTCSGATSRALVFSCCRQAEPLGPELRFLFVSAFH